MTVLKNRISASALLTRALLPYRLRIDEALLTAFTLALCHHNGGTTQVLHLEGHGRDVAVGDDLDLSRTLGWFTTIFPVLLSVDPAEGIRTALVTLKEQLRGFAERGASFGVLRYPE